ncbi:isocitrate/isopropylmalate family dehydrogenase [Streptomyces chiangmaiensis]
MKILVLPGDGIGPEITGATLDVLDTADKRLGLGLAYETHDIGLASLAVSGTTLPDTVLRRVPLVDGVLLGPVSHYEYPRAQRAASTLRQSCAPPSNCSRTSAPAAPTPN